MIPRYVVVLAAAALLFLWAGFNMARLASDQNGMIRVVLSFLLAILVLLRKGRHRAEHAPETRESGHLSPGAVIWIGIAGALLAITGIVFNVRQFEWIGILLLTAACGTWALPPPLSRNILPAFFVLYWAHPVPNQVFGVLQLWMQELSVLGAERLLHIFNVRVWADDMALRTVFNIYDVPEWCSGMRAATTTFILAIGLAILFRVRWFAGIVIVAAALFQTLALNIVRIALMVILTPGIEKVSSTQFLHDTTGIILIATMLLTYLELVAWRHYESHRALHKAELNTEWIEKLSPYPPFWRIIAGHRVLILSTILGILLVAGALFKIRPFHRAEMIKDVATGLRDAGQFEAACRAAFAVQAITPKDDDWNLETVRMLIIVGRFEKALAEARKIPGKSIEMLNQKRVLEAYSLMGLNRMNEAAATVDKLDAVTRRQNPQVAMILAELARIANDPQKTAEHVLVAADWRPNLTRLRALVPYLRHHRKWQAISRVDYGVPHTDVIETLSTAEARMNLNETPRLAELTTQAMKTWPDDPRILEPLFFLAMKRTESNWEDLFATHLLRCAANMENPDTLYGLFDKCFRIARPDLAWAVYRRIEQIDASHPSLRMCATKYGPSWFTFRKRRLGLVAQTAAETVDLRPHFRALILANDTAVLDTIPLSYEILSEIDDHRIESLYLSRALAEFRRRKEKNALSIPMQYEYASALEMAFAVEESTALLRNIAAASPQLGEMSRQALSEVQERNGDWQMVYETLRGYPSVDNPNLRTMLRLCQAQLRLGFGLSAIHTAREAVRLYPTSITAAGALATAISAIDSQEEALFVISRPLPRRDRPLDVLEASLLNITERYNEARRFCDSALISPKPVPPDARQRLALPPAELALFWHRTLVPSNREFEENARRLRFNLPVTTVPFFKKMMPLWLDRHQAMKDDMNAGPAASRGPVITDMEAEIDRWTSCGRDPFEQATALNQLTLLLCWRDHHADARIVAERAVNLFPESAILWRIAVSLSGGDAGVIKAARRKCPDDGELFLSELVVCTQPASPTGKPNRDRWDEQRVLGMISSGYLNNSGGFSPAVMTRASDYLMRIGMKHAASVAANDAVARARGLLPAYIAGLKCALAVRDRDTMTACTKRAIDASIRPIPDLYRKMTELKTVPDAVATDGDMVAALRQLREIYPDNPLWAQMLGYVKFSRGNAELIDALGQMNAAIEMGATNRTPYIIGAEAARLVGNSERAVDILRRGLAHHTNDIVLINNLAFTLASSPTGIVEAAAYAPVLLARAGGIAEIADTAALIYLRSGRLEDAEKISAALADKAEEGSANWFRARMRLAEIAIARAANLSGDARDTMYARSHTILMRILEKSQKADNDDVLAANQLLSEVEAERDRDAARDKDQRP